jgi:hypothetical protein
MLVGAATTIASSVTATVSAAAIDTTVVTMAAGAVVRMAITHDTTGVSIPGKVATCARG